MDAPPHSAPHEDCTCGLYAHHPWVTRRHWHPRVAIMVQGVIEAWGRIEVHRTGFRAEYARPIAILGPTLALPDVVEFEQRLAESYGCEWIDVGEAGSDRPAVVAALCEERDWGMSRPVVNALVVGSARQN